MEALLVITGAIFWIIIACCLLVLITALSWNLILAFIAEGRIAIKFKHPYFRVSCALYLFRNGLSSCSIDGWRVPVYPWQTWESVNQYDEEGNRS